MMKKDDVNFIDRYKRQKRKYRPFEITLAVLFALSFVLVYIVVIGFNDPVGTVLSVSLFLAIPVTFIIVGTMATRCPNRGKIVGGP
ncbi:MAG: hypothetical protein JW969_00995 [Spirochaetales bacterium]|nr:hypothetical protein [Spirochaetales bacterium]